jgi:hypothetical protein
MSEKNPVLAVAKNVREEKSFNLPDGVRVKVVPVSAALIEAVVSRIPDPPVPVIHDEESGKDISNPGHPDYLAAIQRASRMRNAASIDAMLMFGLEIDENTPIPPEGKWIKRLQYLVKLGHLDLSAFDLNDETDREFLYKRYIAANADILSAITGVSGVAEEEISQAEDSFPGEA